MPLGKNAGTAEYYYCVVTSTRMDNGLTAAAISSVAALTITRPSRSHEPLEQNGTGTETETPGPQTEDLTNPFLDVNEKMYCYEAVMWALRDHITEGTSATSFRKAAEQTDKKCLSQGI